MTWDDIMKLKVGGELDYRIEQRIFGRQPIMWHGRPRLKVGYGLPHPVPQYSTDPRAAWEVVDEIIEKQKCPFYLTYCRSADTDDKQDWRAIFAPFTDRLHFVYANGETAPEAICRAALLAAEGVRGD